MNLIHLGLLGTLILLFSQCFEMGAAQAPRQRRVGYRPVRRPRVYPPQPQARPVRIYKPYTQPRYAMPTKRRVPTKKVVVNPHVYSYLKKYYAKQIGYKNPSYSVLRPVILRPLQAQTNSKPVQSVKTPFIYTANRPSVGNMAIMYPGSQGTKTSFTMVPVYGTNPYSMLGQQTYGPLPKPVNLGSQMAQSPGFTYGTPPKASVIMQPSYPQKQQNTGYGASQSTGYGAGQNQQGGYNTGSVQNTGYQQQQSSGYSAQNTGYKPQQQQSSGYSAQNTGYKPQQQQSSGYGSSPAQNTGYQQPQNTGYGSSGSSNTGYGGNQVKQQQPVHPQGNTNGYSNTGFQGGNTAGGYGGQAQQSKSTGYSSSGGFQNTGSSYGPSQGQGQGYGPPQNQGQGYGSNVPQSQGYGPSVQQGSGYGDQGNTGYGQGGYGGQIDICSGIPAGFCSHIKAGHYTHPSSNQCYIQCDAFGKGYGKPCAPGTQWRQLGPEPAHFNMCT